MNKEEKSIGEALFNLLEIFKQMDVEGEVEK